MQILRRWQPKLTLTAASAAFGDESVEALQHARDLFR
jgi:hypothetical protein